MTRVFGKEIVNWINKEQARHRKCACGCGTEIKILVWHRNDGIPKYRKGHDMRGRPSHRKGKHGVYSKETLRKMGLRPQSLARGEKNGNWKGGISTLYNKLRNTPEYHKWRKSVFIRDRFTCVDCGTKGKINAHHKIPFAILRDQAITTFPELDSLDACLLYDPLWETSNGETLCEKCHNLRRKRESNIT